MIVLQRCIIMTIVDLHLFIFLPFLLGVMRVTSTIPFLPCYHRHHHRRRRRQLLLFPRRLQVQTCRQQRRVIHPEKAKIRVL